MIPGRLLEMGIYYVIYCDTVVCMACGTTTRYRVCIPTCIISVTICEITVVQNTSNIASRIGGLSILVHMYIRQSISRT